MRIGVNRFTAQSIAAAKTEKRRATIAALLFLMGCKLPDIVRAPRSRALCVLA